MAGLFSTADRPIGLTTPLGEDKLVLVAFRGEEEMSRLFSFELQLIADAEDPLVDHQAILGEPVTFWVKTPKDEKRFFHGHVNRFWYAGTGDRGHTYGATVVPKFWFLTRKTNCRVFQEMTVPDIVKEVLSGIEIEDQMQGNFAVEEYHVQYRETDFNFVSRLLEKEGIYYYFKHEDGSHKMVLGDAPGAHVECFEDNEVQLLSNLSQPEITDQISAWEHVYEVRSGKYALWDYSYERPSSHVDAESPTMNSVANNSEYELFDFPCDYSRTQPSSSNVEKMFEQNSRYADLRMQEEEQHYDNVQGTSGCRTFSPGHTFKLARASQCCGRRERLRPDEGHSLGTCRRIIRLGRGTPGQDLREYIPVPAEGDAVSAGSDHSDPGHSWCADGSGRRTGRGGDLYGR